MHTRDAFATRQREIAFARPLIGEEERRAVLEVLESPVLVHGPKSHEFEEAFAVATAAPHAVGLSSCTAAMHLAYEAWGIGEGDEVIVPAQTHTATAHAVIMAGATPVFVDVDPATGNVTADLIKSAITARTRAIAVVHFVGVPVDMKPIIKLAQKHKLKILEDCALALGAIYDGQHVGLLGDAGCFSFYPVKHMTTAEGGMLITRDKALAQRVARIRAFGVDRTPAERAEPGIYDVTLHGYNYRMNELEAALGLEQLKKTSSWLTIRQRNATRLKELLSDIPHIRHIVGGSYYCYSIILENHDHPRATIAAELKERGVGTSVYYPHPVPHMTYYRQTFGYSLDTFPVAAEISNWSIALPVGPHVTEEDMNYIAEQLHAICNP